MDRSFWNEEDCNSNTRENRVKNPLHPWTRDLGFPVQVGGGTTATPVALGDETWDGVVPWLEGIGKCLEGL
jgi:hypothetical protein